MLSWHDIGRQLLRHRRTLIGAHGFALLSVLLSVPLPLMMPVLVDEVLLHKPGWVSALLGTLFPANLLSPVFIILVLLVVVVVMRLIGLAADVCQTNLFSRVAKAVSSQLRVRLVRQLSRAELSAYENLGTAAVSSRLTMDVETLDHFIGPALSRLVINVLTLTGVLAILLCIHWQLALVLLLLNPAMIILARMLGKQVGALKQQENQAFEDMQQGMVETLDAVVQIKANRQERGFFPRVVWLIRQLRRRATDARWKSEAVYQLTHAVYMIGFDIFRTLAMLTVLFSDLSIGQMFAVFAYLWFMMTPLQELLSMQYAYHQAEAARARLNEIMAMPVEDEEVGMAGRSGPMQIRLEELSFAYPGQTKVLDRVSMTLEPGQKIGLVALSGGGKSTLVNLILGLYPHQGGQILLDGAPIEDIGRHSLREQAVTLVQQPVFFNASIRDNLTAGGPAVADNQLWQVLKLAELEELVAAMAQGLNTQVGRGGIRLSGGQRQRLMLARMMLSPAPMVILDEAMSALDAVTEQRLLANMAPLLEGRTVLMISHRLSSLRHADVIYVLDDGKIGQAGSHDELASQEGLYQTLLAAQS